MKYDFELIPVPTDALEAVGIIPALWRKPLWTENAS